MILLDTHVWIWLLAAPQELSETAMRTAAENEDSEQIQISAISVWELFLLVKNGRVSLKVPPVAFLTATHGNSRVSITPIDDTIARRSVELPDIHADPADRIIISTAEFLGCPIISRDRRFAEYNLVPVIW